LNGRETRTGEKQQAALVAAKPAVERAKAVRSTQGVLVRFAPDFEIMPGTRSAKPVSPPSSNAFEVERLAVKSITDYEAESACATTAAEVHQLESE
jgi:hypothetical protein